jgi:glycogen debranching enzyme
MPSRKQNSASPSPGRTQKAQGNGRNCQFGMKHPPSNWQVRLRPRDTTVYVSQGRTVLATSTDGFVFEHPEHGLWVYQTRMLSRYRWLINGQTPRRAGNSNMQQHTWMGYYIASPPNIKDTGLDEKDPAQQTVELRLTRYVGAGMHEDVDVTNFTQTHTSIRLELEVDSDFADPHEAGGQRKQRGKLERRWKLRNSNEAELEYDYRVQHAYHHQDEKGVARMHRGIRLTIARAGSRPHFHRKRIAFVVDLPPHGTWHACLDWVPHIEGEWKKLGHSCYFSGVNEWDRKRGDFLQHATAFSSVGSGTLAPVVVEALEQSKRDLAALRLYDLDNARGWVPAGGLPEYVALFGRDSLTASWEADLVGLEMSGGTLLELARTQATEMDDWRDEQPGRIVHEVHTNPLATLNFNPHGRYYGGVTGAIYYPVVVAGLWHWTGNKELVRPLIAPALRGLEWADTYCDLDGDGFYEYQTRSQQGEKNQGWKDSGDAIVYEDGSQVRAPLGTCEMQSFTYASKLHLSEVLWWLDEKELAARFFDEASELKKRFNEAFWMENEGYIAMGLDSRKRQIKSIGSDPGHALASGIVEIDHVERAAARLMAPDMFSGWGIRTLSAKHPAYNPYSYHRGTVWPVENAVFALAFARYGLHELMFKLCEGQFEAASLFDYFRLPECFAGHQREPEHPFPGMYPKANWPQAWSASAALLHVQAMIGLYPYAPLHALLIDPHLPAWLPEITLHNLRVREVVTSLRFYRREDGSSDYEVLEKRGHLHVVRQPSPWSLTAGFGERVRDAVASLLPGK